MSLQLELSKFNPKILEKKRRNGHAPIIVFLGKRGSGKCLAPHELVQTSKGELVRADSINIGDKLMGDDSNPREVLNISQGTSKMYKIKQNNGEDYIVNENHVLSLYVNKNISVIGVKYYEGEFIDLPLQVLINLPKDIKKELKGYKANKDLSNIEIEDLGIGPYYGFEVDGNHRFLLKDFTVTHNSTLVSDILYYLQRIPVVVAMSGTEEGNGYYSRHIHPLCIHNKFDKAVLEGLIERQKKVVFKLKASGEDPRDHPEIGIGVLMDDLQYDNKMMKDPSIREIFMNGRHYHITTMITFQYMMGLTPSFRSNVDYVFICKENKKDNIDRLYKYFFSIFDKPADFKKVLGSCTNDFGCIVLDNTSISNKIEDQVFWYKAKMGREYQIGSKKMWKMWNSQLRDEDSDDEDQGLSNESSMQKSTIIIKKKGPKKVEIKE